MRRRTLTLTSIPRFFLGLTALAALGGSGCTPDPGPLTWKELQPRYFAALNLQDEATQKALPDFEQRMEKVAKDLLVKLDEGELTDDAERADAGLMLLYQGFLLHVAQHGLEDGYLKSADFLRPQRYAAGGDDQAELSARLARSSALLSHAAELRPDDQRLATLALSVRYNRESLLGPHSPPLLLEELTGARGDLFSLFATMILWRDPTANSAENAGNAEHIKQLVAAVCAPDRFDCNRMGPPSAPPRPLDGERKLTQEVNGPVLVADLLVRRAEALLAQADIAPNPMAKAPLLAEAMGRLQYAKGTMAFVTTNVADPALAHYPARAHLPPRVDRIEQLLAATTARQAAMADPPALPDADYYTSRAYRAPYQCVACHTKGPTTMGFPK
jgi:mono/diheme cytochrome c family protein